VSIANRPTATLPPTHTQGLLPLLQAPTAYHHIVVPRAHGSTGVFQNTSLDLDYCHSTLLYAIISAREINAPVTYQRNFVSFYEGMRARKGMRQQPTYSPCIHACP
jgi:hypothetical protein